MEQLIRLVLAYDQGIEHGPIDFNSQNIDPNYVLELARDFDAIVLQKGIAEKYFNNQTKLIVKINGKTSLRSGEPISRQTASVKEAQDLGAIGVGYTIYLGSEYESEMIKEFSKIEQEADKLGMIAIGWMYPRGKSVKQPKSPANVAYAARVGLELGAEYVKINYPGSVEALAWAVKAAGKTKVLVAGGKKVKEAEFLDFARDIKKAGAYGLAVGRNVWQSEKPQELVKKLKPIIYG